MSKRETLELPEVRGFIIDMYRRGLGPKAISGMIAERFGLEVSADLVRRKLIEWKQRGLVWPDLAPSTQQDGGGGQQADPMASGRVAPAWTLSSPDPAVAGALYWQTMNCATELLPLLVYSMVEEDRRKFSEAGPRREVLRSRGELDWYRVPAEKAEVALDILGDIMATVSGVQTVAALEVMDFVNFIISKVRPDPLDPGVMVVEAHPEDMGSYIVQLRALLAAALGEYLREGMYRGFEALLWLHSDKCPMCKEIMSGAAAKEFERFERLVSAMGVHYMRLNLDDPHMAARAYSYLPPALVSSLETPAIVYINVPARRILYWTSFDTVDPFPLRSHVPRLYEQWLEVEVVEGRRVVKGARPNAAANVLRQIFEGVLPLYEARGRLPVKREAILREAENLLREGPMSFQDLVRKVASRLRANQSYVRDVLASQMGTRFTVEGEGREKLVRLVEQP